MAKYRPDRIGEEVKKSISNFLINGAKDPRLTKRIISISGVSVSRDGRHATCYISPLILSDENKDVIYEEVLDAFNNAKGMIRGRVSRDVKLRYTPELVFKIDMSSDYGNYIDSLIEGIK